MGRLKAVDPTLLMYILGLERFIMVLRLRSSHELL